MGLLNENGLRAYFSKRVDRNMSYIGGLDAKFDVLLNRLNVSLEHGFSAFSAPRLPKKVVPHGFSPKLEHGDKVLIIRDSERENFDGLGVARYDGLPCDAIVSNAVKFPLILPNRDCHMVLLHDQRKKVMAVFHSGREGALCNIAGKTAGAMRREFQCKPENIKAYFFPAICGQCYIMDFLPPACGPEFLAVPGFVRKTNDEKFFLDLELLITSQLRKAGIEQIDARRSECTFHTRQNGTYTYFSHYGCDKKIIGHREPGNNALFVEMHPE